MTRIDCPREDEMIAVVLSRAVHGQGGGPDAWLDACGDDVRTHVGACEVCRAGVSVAVHLRAEATTASREVHVPSPGQVWWRAAIRARADVAHQAERPLTWVHGLAGACAAGLIAAVGSSAWPSVERAATWLGSRSWSVPAPAVEAAGPTLDMLQSVLAPVLLATACVFLVPLAIYLATSAD
jgi:hypothetical protein